MRGTASRPRDVPPVSRALTGLAAVLFLAGHVAGTLHYATVRHERCATHGELIHADGDGPHRGKYAPAGPHGPDEPTTRPGGPKDEPHAEERCVLATATREEAAGARNASPTLDASHVLPLRLGGTRPALPSGPASYRLAPKQSPPA